MTATSTANAIEARNITKSYGSFSLNHVSFEVPRGYITGLIGPNGAGKSSMIRMMMGMIIPDDGSLSIHGQTVTPAEGGFRQQIGYVSDENIFYEYLTLAQMKKIIAPFYEEWDEDLYTKYIELFELPQHKKLQQCSKGMKMKFAIATALAHHPRLLIMDEPTAGLDPVFRRELLDLLADYILDENNTILFSTHLTTDLDRVADYIVFLNNGNLILNENKEEILERYVIVKGGRELLNHRTRSLLVGERESQFGFEGLSANREAAAALLGDRVTYERPTLEDIIYFTSKGGNQHV